MKKKKTKAQIEEMVNRYVKMFDASDKGNEDIEYAEDCWRDSFLLISWMKLKDSDTSNLKKQYESLSKIGTVAAIQDGFSVTTKKIVASFTKNGISINSPLGVPNKKNGIVDYGRIRPALFDLCIKEDYASVVRLLEQFVESK